MPDPASRSDVPMPPGVYLARRRAARGLRLQDVALRLAALPQARGPLGAAQLAAMVARLGDAEAGRDPLGPIQARLVAQCVGFDPAVYLALVDLAAVGRPNSGLPEPRVCRACACSWNDGCRPPRGPCAWSDADPGLCTACARAEAAAKPATPPFLTPSSIPARAQPEGAPA